MTTPSNPRADDPDALARRRDRAPSGGDQPSSPLAASLDPSRRH
ncbi:hypothetical protein [Streptomyces sp. NBC_00878]|nr:hypothetical protein [Streptomyces sp. NBC_00878]MCX4908479.1 hypothetical protein [Streptomyces sp. NBC_00878]